MKKIFAVLALGALTLGFRGEDNQVLCAGFVPENDLWISADFKAASGGIDEAQFNKVIDKIETIFRDKIRQSGGLLNVKRNWTDGTVNASANRSGNTWFVNMYGGLARHQTMTEDGFALVMCHELGHHIGGAPKYAGSMSRWASNEGQADYFAGLKCLRKYFEGEDNEEFLRDKEVDPTIIAQCDSEQSDAQMKLICARIALAGEAVSFLFQTLRKETTAPRFDTPDQKVQQRTIDSHPGTQCRMDTYFAGGVCGVDANEEVSQSDYRTGTCIESNSELGHRPLCWFAPTSSSL